VILLALALATYFVPTFVAMMRNGANVSAVLLVNLLTGWSVIGWVAALVMACTGQRRVPPAGCEPGLPSSVYARPVKVGPDGCRFCSDGPCNGLCNTIGGGKALTWPATPS
jgi:hypothetical protein